MPTKTMDIATLHQIVSDKADFGTFGRFTETPVNEMDADMKSAYDYTLKLRGLVPGPHMILRTPTDIFPAMEEVCSVRPLRTTDPEELSAPQVQKIFRTACRITRNYQ
jgi:hypothetical protein